MIPISGGRYLVITTMDRLDDNSGGGVYIDLKDRKGYDVPLMAVSDYLTDKEDESIRLMVSYSFEDDELESVHKWSKQEIEKEEGVIPAQKKYSISFSAKVDVEAVDETAAIKEAWKKIDSSSSYFKFEKIKENK